MKIFCFVLAIVAGAGAQTPTPAPTHAPCRYSREILLVVFMKHQPNLEMLGFWQRGYPFPVAVYADQTDCNPKATGQPGMPCEGRMLNTSSFPPDVHFIPRLGGGWYMQKVLMQAIRDYPDFEGYLFLVDDVQLNFWETRRLNRTKAWLGSYDEKLNPDKVRGKLCSTVAKPQLAFERMPRLREWHDATSAEYRDLIEKNFGRADALCQSSQNDFIYLPKWLTPAWLDVCEQMTEFGLLFPACFNNGVFGTTSKENIIQIGSMYRKKGAKGDVIEHPVKFSNAENRRRFADMWAQHCPRAVDALAMIVPATVKKVSVKVGIWRQEKRAAGFWIQFEQVSPRAR